MIEHSTWPIVLKRESVKEKDDDYTLFTWHLGKVRARTASTRKITSKLAGHLEPGTIGQVRMVQRSLESPLRLVEALSEAKTKDLQAIRVLEFAEKITPFHEEDHALFITLKRAVIDGVDERSGFRKILALSGFDPKCASCDWCGSKKIAYFLPDDIIFLCKQCFEKRKNMVSDGNGRQ